MTICAVGDEARRHDRDGTRRVGDREVRGLRRAEDVEAEQHVGAAAGDVGPRLAIGFVAIRRSETTGPAFWLSPV